MSSEERVNNDNYGQLFRPEEEAMVRAATLLTCILLLGCGECKITSECRMGWEGDGHCTFSNLGDSPGGICGKVTILRDFDTEVGDSETLCSGEIAAKSSMEVDFSVPEVCKGCLDPRFAEVELIEDEEEHRRQYGLLKPQNEVCKCVFVEAK